MTTTSQITRLALIVATVDSLQQWADAVDDQSYTWDNMLQWYQKSANYALANAKLRLLNATAPNDAGAFTAGAGPLYISYPNYANPLGTYYPGAFEELSLNALPNGVNIGSLIGYSYSTVTVNPDNETCDSSESSFLGVAAAITQLTLYKNTMAEKILFDDNKVARGVLVNANNKQFTLSVNKEVILSAGVIQSPQLLMVSGVGLSAVLN